MSVIVDFDMAHTVAAQGDLIIYRLSQADADRLNKTTIIRPAQRGTIRLLEGEVTGHHHEIVMEPDGDEANAIATAALAIAKARASVRVGRATLYQDDALLRSLPFLTRTDLAIGFLHVHHGPVILRHPEHYGIRLFMSTYYIGRQIESAGAEDRVVAD